MKKAQKQHEDSDLSFFLKVVALLLPAKNCFLFYEKWDNKAKKYKRNEKNRFLYFFFARISSYCKNRTIGMAGIRNVLHNILLVSIVLRKYCIIGF